MILLDHCLAGLAVGLAAPVDGSGVCVAAVAGGVLPDLDIVLGRPGTFGYLKYHRKQSHSAVLAPFMAVGIAAIVKVSGATACVFSLACVALAGLVLHLAMDALNAFGTHLGWPLSRRRIHADLLYEFDPALSLLLATTVGAQAAAHAGLMRCSGLQVGLVGLLIVVVYAGMRAAGRRLFVRRVEEHARGLDEPVVRCSVVPASYWRWKGIVVTSRFHYVLRQTPRRLAVEIRPRAAIPGVFRTKEVLLYEAYARHLDVRVEENRLTLQNLVYSPSTYKLVATFPPGRDPSYSISLPSIGYADY